MPEPYPLAAFADQLAEAPETADHAPYLDDGPSHSPSLRQTERDSVSHDDLLDALEAVSQPECPSLKNRFAFDVISRRAFPLSCRSWSCPVCRVHRANLAGRIVRFGLEAAHERNQPCAHLVVTDQLGLRFRDLNDRWRLLRQRLRRLGVMGAHVTVVGGNPRRRHLHVVTVAGEFAPQKILAEHSRSVGLGPQLSIARLKPGPQHRDRLSAYLAANALAYVREAAHGSRERLRPVRISPGWPGGSLSRPAFRSRSDSGRFLRFHAVDGRIVSKAQP